ncbi:MAG TPA: hypothetical protein DCM26_00945 [Desulfotomaculum sp.]|jgi:hypothetical protein|nr:hypothetical protein [Desulfotomaculum sp.]
MPVPNSLLFPLAGEELVQLRRCFLVHAAERVSEGKAAGRPSRKSFSFITPNNARLQKICFFKSLAFFVATQ